MDTNSETVRFEVLVNKERRCIAGIDGLGVLTTITKWVMRDPAVSPGNEGWARQRLLFSVRGHRIPAEQSVNWVTDDISVGDEITIRVLGPGQFDEPRMTNDPEVMDS